MKKRYENGTVPELNKLARANVASQLRRLRRESNLTQAELAELTGTKKSNISRMESGNYNPSLDFLVKIAESMNLNLNVTLEHK